MAGDTIEFLNHLIEINEKRLQVLRAKEAFFGWNAQPEIMIEIDFIREKIEQIKKEKVSAERGEVRVDITTPDITAFARMLYHRAKENIIIANELEKSEEFEVETIIRYRRKARDFLEDSIDYGFVEAEVFFDLGNIYRLENTPEYRCKALLYYIFSTTLKKDFMEVYEARKTLCEAILEDKSYCVGMVQPVLLEDSHRLHELAYMKKTKGARDG